jgi:hypothetical protein
VKDRKMSQLVARTKQKDHQTSTLPDHNLLPLRLCALLPEDFVMQLHNSIRKLLT